MGKRLLRGEKSSRLRLLVGHDRLFLLSFSLLSVFTSFDPAWIWRGFLFLADVVYTCFSFLC